MSTEAKSVLSKQEARRQRYIVEYIRSLKEIEDAMEPYKEHRRDLRNDYKRQGWLTRDEMSVAVKAYRLMKGEVDLDELYETYSVLSTAANPDIGSE
jgi:hypothetical protein|tara:strand:- start:536 stop:826 length:291 start_codon:yes stop_codon:yes gene_type:complete